MQNSTSGLFYGLLRPEKGRKTENRAKPMEIGRKGGQKWNFAKNIGSFDSLSKTAYKNSNNGPYRMSEEYHSSALLYTRYITDRTEQNNRRRQ